jgi:hypothetical protein
MDNYSARDVDHWARTLLADQFEQLQILGPASQISSFRQYAITNPDSYPEKFINSSVKSRTTLSHSK